MDVGIICGRRAGLAAALAAYIASAGIGVAATSLPETPKIKKQAIAGLNSTVLALDEAAALLAGAIITPRPVYAWAPFNGFMRRRNPRAPRNGQRKGNRLHTSRRTKAKHRRKA